MFASSHGVVLLAKGILVIVLLLIVPAAALTEVYLLLHNGFAANGRWIASKEKCGIVPVGAKRFATGLQALAGNRLNLGAWFGFQEVLSKEFYSPDEIEFDFRLGKNAYLAFVLQDDDGSSFGFRMGTHRGFWDITFAADITGKFLDRRLVVPMRLKTDEWYHCKIVKNESEGAVSINGRPMRGIIFHYPDTCRVGFRNGLNAAYVDNVVIRDNNLTSIETETFANYRNWPVVLAVFFSIGVLMDLLMGINFLRRAGTDFEVIMGVVTLNAVLAIASVIAIVCALYFQNYYARGTGMSPSAFIETEREKVFGRLVKSYAKEDFSGKCRILVTGSSQTFGCGALDENDTYVSQLQQRLNERFGQHMKFECLNAGVRAADSGALVDALKNHLFTLRPDLVVVDLSNNDSGRTSPQIQFGSYLRQFIDLCHAHNVELVFVLEANSTEKTPGDLPLHRTMRRLARNLGVPVIELHEEMKRYYDDGFLWWDYVHPTSYGHALIADCIFRGLIDNGIVGDEDILWRPGILQNETRRWLPDWLAPK
jgi:lysophospholipase L1-like esterase